MLKANTMLTNITMLLTIVEKRKIGYDAIVLLS